MTELKELLTILSGIGTFVFLIGSNLNGILYDDKRHKYDHSYKGNHSFYSYKYGLVDHFSVSIPFPIEHKENGKFQDELKVLTTKYNRTVYVFWISLILFIYSELFK
jgi:hypothetical protein